MAGKAKRQKIEEIELTDQDSPQSRYSVFEITVSDLIFQHLSPKTLLEISKTSDNWNRIIAKSNALNERIYVKAGYPDSLNGLEASSRHYQNIELQIRNDPESIRKGEALCERFSRYVKSFKIIKYGGHNKFLNNALDFERLHDLELQISCGRITGDFLQNTRNLRKLIINGMEYDGMLQCLRNNCKLEDLTLIQNSFINYFKLPLRAKKLNLKKLSVLDHNRQPYRLTGEFDYEWNVVSIRNCLKFITAQLHLKYLELDAWSFEYMHKILAIDSLEVLAINQFEGDCSTTVPVKNENICAFLTKSQDITSIAFMLSLCENLEALFMQKFTFEMYKAITSHNNNNIEHFKCFWSSEIDEKNVKLPKKTNLQVFRSSKEDFLKMYELSFA